MGTNGWLQYFHPICGGGQTKVVPWREPTVQGGVVVELDKMVDAHRPWYHEVVETKSHGIFGYYVGPWRAKNQTVYDEEWYASQRARGARLLSRYVHLRPRVVKAANSAWREIMKVKSGGCSKVIGLHMRGTDVLNIDSQFADRVMTQPDAYLPLVRAYLREEPGALVFLATDDQRMLDYATGYWPMDIVRVLRWRNISRPTEGFKGQCGDDTYQAGLDALLDVLLLSRCNFLVHSSSNIPELSIMFNPSLHSNSYNLRFSSGHDRNWLYQNNRKMEASTHQLESGTGLGMPREVSAPFIPHWSSFKDLWPVPHGG